MLTVVDGACGDASVLDSASGELWRESALCAQIGGDLWFPEVGGSDREAKRICGRCEVRDDCLDYALVHDEGFGIWGGLTERERRQLQRGVPVGESSLVVQVRRMAAGGMLDREIASAVGMHPDTVGRLRRRHGIPRAGQARDQPKGMS